MGMDVYAQLGYGFIIYESEGEQDPLFDVIDELTDIRLPYDEYNGKIEEYSLDRYSLTEALYDSFPGITTIDFGSCDYITIALIASESLQSSDSWGVSPLTIPEFDPRWDNLLKETCEKVGLEYKQPEWLFGAYYSN